MAAISRSATNNSNRTNAPSNAVTTQPRIGTRVTNDAAKSHAATPIAAVSRLATSAQNHRANRDGLRAAKRAAVCMACPVGTIASFSGTAGASETLAAGTG